MATTMMQVGATVRLARPNHPKSTGRALIATLQDDSSTCCILWEDPAPRPLASRKFLVAPRIVPSKLEETEYTVKQDEVQPLLDFEYDTEIIGGNVDTATASVEVWKDRGDQLLRLGDASAACSYYEMALSLSSSPSATTASKTTIHHPQVGSTILVKKDGFAQIAEVDCVNEQDLDITFVQSGDEATIQSSEILLVVMAPDPQRVQERILLNLARCLLQLADMDKTDLDRPSRYRSNAVLASTLALTLATFHEEQQEQASISGDLPSKTQQTALLLRSQAQAQRSKWSHAISDVKQLLKAHPNHKEGCKLLQQIEQQKARHKLADKKLAKQMCQWVNQATTTSTEDSSVSPCNEDESTAKTNNSTPAEVALNLTAASHTSSSSLLFSSGWVKLLLIPLVVAWLVHQVMKGRIK